MILRKALYFILSHNTSAPYLLSSHGNVIRIDSFKLIGVYDFQKKIICLFFSKFMHINQIEISLTDPKLSILLI